MLDLLGIYKVNRYRIENFSRGGRCRRRETKRELVCGSRWSAEKQITRYVIKMIADKHSKQELRAIVHMGTHTNRECIREYNSRLLRERTPFQKLFVYISKEGGRKRERLSISTS